jgi:murein DD-endopeptidase MepM/ murein hydrolase activator NlpD
VVFGTVAPGTTAGTETDATPDVAEVTATTDPADLGIIQVESQEGESLADVATRWGLDVSTLVWANEGIEDPTAVLEAGTLVTIPPVDGVIHEVAQGETLDSIAQLYGVNPWDITSVTQNGVQSDEDLYPGLQITVPYAMPQTRGGLAIYTVKVGDDLWKIGDYYGIDGLTIAYANDIPDPYLIYPDQELVIPPADGVLYYAVEGDTVESIATAFGVDPALIRDFPFNNLPGTSQPTPGQAILIPGLTPITDSSKGGGGGEPSDDPFAAASEDASTPAAATGTFMWPASGNLSQSFSAYHNGVDIANTAWSPIVASDGGVVTFAGWNEYGLGYAVELDHENGFVTWYGHLAEAPAVVVGQRVGQGEWLGPMGDTGKATGPHLHFILMQDGVYQDPLAYLP